MRRATGQRTELIPDQPGPVVAGESLEAAVFATEELEETAKLYLLLRNLNPRYLSPAQVQDLVQHFGLELPADGHTEDHAAEHGHQGSA